MCFSLFTNDEVSLCKGDNREIADRWEVGVRQHALYMHVRFKLSKLLHAKQALELQLVTITYQMTLLGSDPGGLRYASIWQLLAGQESGQLQIRTRSGDNSDGCRKNECLKGEEDKSLPITRVL